MGEQVGKPEVDKESSGSDHPSLNTELAEISVINASRNEDEHCWTDDKGDFSELLTRSPLDDVMKIKLCHQILSIAAALHQVPFNLRPEYILVQKSRDQKGIALKVVAPMVDDARELAAEKEESQTNERHKEEEGTNGKAPTKPDPDEQGEAHILQSSGTGEKYQALAEGGINQKVTLTGNSVIGKQVFLLHLSRCHFKATYCIIG